MQIEMMSESIDETLDKDEAEEETEELTNQVKSRCPGLFSFYRFVPIIFSNSHFSISQVLDEIGVDIASQVCFIPRLITSSGSFFHSIFYSL